MRRLDANRAVKRGEGGPLQAVSCVAPPLHPSAFNFSKVHADEVLFAVADERYSVIVNMYPLARRHVLLCSTEVRPQQLIKDDVGAIAALLSASPGLSAWYNSWGASASVNHMHVHIVDDALPALRRPLRLAAARAPFARRARLQLDGFPAAEHFVYVYASVLAAPRVARAVAASSASAAPDDGGVAALWNLVAALHSVGQVRHTRRSSQLRSASPRLTSDRAHHPRAPMRSFAFACARSPTTSFFLEASPSSSRARAIPHGAVASRPGPSATPAVQSSEGASRCTRAQTRRSSTAMRCAPRCATAAPHAQRPAGARAPICKKAALRAGVRHRCPGLTVATLNNRNGRCPIPYAKSMSSAPLSRYCSGLAS